MVVVGRRGVLAEEGATQAARRTPIPQPVAVADVAQQKKRTIPNNRITPAVLLRLFLTRWTDRVTGRLTAKEVVGAVQNVVVVAEEEREAVALGTVVGLVEEVEENEEEGEEGEEDEGSLRTLTPHHRTLRPITDRWRQRQGRAQQNP